MNKYICFKYNYYRMHFYESCPGFKYCSSLEFWSLCYSWDSYHLLGKIFQIYLKKILPINIITYLLNTLIN